MQRKTLLGWGLGSFTSSALVGAVGLLHMRYMTDSLGLSMALAGALVVISRVYDAVMDPFVGAISDRTRTRFGRYRPYVLGGGLLCATSMVMLFNVPTFLTGYGLVAFVAASLILYSSGYALYRIPYLALGRTIAQDFGQRSKQMTISVYGSSAGTLTAASAAPFLLAHVGSDRAGHGLVALILGALIAMGAIATFLLITTERVEPGAELKAPPPHPGFRETIAALRSNTPFQCLMGFKMMMFIGLAVHNVAVPFFSRHLLKESDSILGYLHLAQTSAMVLSQVVWIWIAGRIGRRNALLLAGSLKVFVMFVWYFVPLDQPTPWLQICGALNGIAAGGIFFGMYALLTDIMDYSRRRPGGTNQEGVLAGVFVMIEKATAALGAAIFGGVMSWAGYISAKDVGSVVQPENVTPAVMFAIAIIPAFFSLLGCLFLRKLDIGDGAFTNKKSSIGLEAKEGAT